MREYDSECPCLFCQEYRDKETKMEKWKSLKPITLKAITEEGVIFGCTDFARFARRIVKEHYKYGWMEIPIEVAQSNAEALNYDDWFIDHGFIEAVKEEKFWKYGDWVMNNSYRIVQCGRDDCCLIAKHNGNRKRDFINVEDSDKITLAEMKAMGYEGK